MYLVIFDCDGTLIDSQETIVHGLKVGFETVGLEPPDRSRALSIVGLSLDIAFQHLLEPQYHHLVPQMADAYRQSQLARRAAGLDHDPLYPGAMAALDALGARPDVLLGIATGKAMRGVVHMQEMHGLQGRFVTIQTADRAPSKPNPGMILQAMDETGVAPERTVMIGDTSYDMEMARNAGVGAIAVTWGYHDRAQLEAGGADVLIDRFDQLEQVVADRFCWDRDLV
ncbi:HAD-IA family hydrolase [Stappia indica]|nr:HAD-IA family hydrolase [Stappia indica]